MAKSSTKKQDKKEKKPGAKSKDYMGRNKASEGIINLGRHHNNLWYYFLLSSFGRMDDGIPEL